MAEMQHDTGVALYLALGSLKCPIYLIYVTINFYPIKLKIGSSAIQEDSRGLAFTRQPSSRHLSAENLLDALLSRWAPGILEQTR